MKVEKDKKKNVFSLPDIEVRKTMPIRFVNKAISLTFIILFVFIVTGIIVLFFLRTNISISADGILEPSKITHIHSIESGIIKKVLVKSGDTIRLNQALVYLDSIELKKNLSDIKSQIALDNNSYYQKKEKTEYDTRENKLSLETAQAQLIKAKASFRDHISGYFPKANMDSLVNNYKSGMNITLDYAMADIKLAQNAIKLNMLYLQKVKMIKYDIVQLQIDLNKLYEQESIIREKLKHLVLKSPVTGVVLTEGIENLSNSYVMEGTKLFDIAETKDWDAILFVNENEIHQIKINDRVKIKLSALQSTDNYELYSASVTSIGAEKISEKKEYISFAGMYRVSVRLKFSKSNNLYLANLKSGYKVNGEIITDSGKIIVMLIKYFKKLF